MVLNSNDLIKLFASPFQVLDEDGDLIEVPLFEDRDEQQITEGAAYDLRLGKVSRLHPSDAASFLIDGRVTPRTQPIAPEPDRRMPSVFRFEPYLLGANYYLVQTIERINTPSNLVPRIRPRTSMFRAGLLLICSDVSPNYQGRLTLGLVNLRSVPAEIQEGFRIANIRFSQLTAPEPHLYNGVWQGGRMSTEGQPERPY